MLGEEIAPYLLGLIAHILYEAKSSEHNSLGQGETKVLRVLHRCES